MPHFRTLLWASSYLSQHASSLANERTCSSKTSLNPYMPFSIDNNCITKLLAAMDSYKTLRSTPCKHRIIRGSEVCQENSQWWFTKVLSTLSVDVIEHFLEQYSCNGEFAELSRTKGLSSVLHVYAPAMLFFKWGERSITSPKKHIPLDPLKAGCHCTALYFVFEPLLWTQKTIHIKYPQIYSSMACVIQIWAISQRPHAHTKIWPTFPSNFLVKACSRWKSSLTFTENKVRYTKNWIVVGKVKGKEERCSPCVCFQKLPLQLYWLLRYKSILPLYISCWRCYKIWELLSKLAKLPMWAKSKWHWSKTWKWGPNTPPQHSSRPHW